MAPGKLVLRGAGVCKGLGCLLKMRRGQRFFCKKIILKISRKHILMISEI